MTDSALALPTSGPVSERQLYVERPSDALLVERLARQPFVTVRAPRTMGKTSAITRMARQKLLGQGAVLLHVDLRDAKGRDVAEWLDDVAYHVRGQLSRYRLDPGEGTGPPRHMVGERLLGHLRDGGQAGGRAILVLDEIESLANLDYREAIYDGLAACRNRLGDADFNGALCTVGLGFLSDQGGPYVAPTAGPVDISDFTVEDAIGPITAIVACLTGTVEEEVVPLVARVIDFSGGQPFLTMHLLNDIVDNIEKCSDLEGVEQLLADHVWLHRRDLGLSVGERELSIATPTIQFRQIVDMLNSDVPLGQVALQIYSDLLLGDPRRGWDEPKATELLLASGLIRPALAGGWEVKSEYFRRVFDQGWASLMRSALLRESRREPRSPPTTEQKRICIINFGGTIGMFRKVDRGGRVSVRAPVGEAEFLKHYWLLGQIRHSTGIACSYDDALVAKDSINVVPRDWTDLANRVRELIATGEYDGIVVAHGTDTMAYTASALAYAFGNGLDRPVVFTGAQTTADVVYGDGHMNLARAVITAALGQDLREVVIAFDTQVLRATRAVKRDEAAFAGFESPRCPALAEISGSIEVGLNANHEAQAASVNLGNVQIVTTKLLDREEWIESGQHEFSPAFAARVLPIMLTPGLEPGYFLELLKRSADAPEHAIHGIVLQTLGAGNILNQSPFDFIGFIGQATRMGIPVLVTSSHPWSPALSLEYEPALAAVENGAVPAGEMTTAAAIVKFRWAIAQVAAEHGSLWTEIDSAARVAAVKRVMDAPRAGEKTPFEDRARSPMRTRSTHG